MIHKQTTNADGSVNKTANLMAHAVLGAVVSLAQNNSAPEPPAVRRVKRRG